MFLYIFYKCIVFRIFSFILLPPRLKIPATYEAQQVPPEWSPKFLLADLLFCVTLPLRQNSLCVAFEKSGSFLSCMVGVNVMFVRGIANC